jgi:hypothetical protein
MRKRLSGTGWEVIHAALFLILERIFLRQCAYAFFNGGHLGGIVRG